MVEKDLWQEKEKACGRAIEEAVATSWALSQKLFGFSPKCQITIGVACEGILIVGSTGSGKSSGSGRTTVNYPQLADKTRGIVCSCFTSLVDVINRGLLRDLFCEETNLTPEAVEQGKIILIDMPVKEFMEVGVAGRHAAGGSPTSPGEVYSARCNGKGTPGEAEVRFPGNPHDEWRGRGLPQPPAFLHYLALHVGRSGQSRANAGPA